MTHDAGSFFYTHTAARDDKIAIAEVHDGFMITVYSGSDDWGRLNIVMKHNAFQKLIEKMTELSVRSSKKE